jgi:alkylhydroperoxidase family enzyme
VPATLQLLARTTLRAHSACLQRQLNKIKSYGRAVELVTLTLVVNVATSSAPSLLWHVPRTGTTINA